MLNMAFSLDLNFDFFPGHKTKKCTAPSLESARRFGNYWFIA